MIETIQFNIKRFDGEKTWVQTYHLRYEKNKTVLWALTKIREEQDPTLNFTSACGHAICGSCSVQINGHAFLTCKTTLDEVIEAFRTWEWRLEPLNHFEVIRDLVIFWDPKMEKMKKVQPWLISEKEPKKGEGYIQSESDYNKISSPTDCILCGACTSQCNQLNINEGNFLDPFIINRAYRFVVDSRDEYADERVETVVHSELWKCLHCMQCVSVCPKKIPLTDQIAFLRRESIALGIIKSKGARHAMAFHKDVLYKGRLNEITLPIRTEGFIKTLSKVRFALRMLRSGKLNPLHQPKNIKGIEGVRKLYEYADEVKGGN